MVDERCLNSARGTKPTSRVTIGRFYAASTGIRLGSGIRYCWLRAPDLNLRLECKGGRARHFQDQKPTHLSSQRSSLRHQWTPRRPRARRGLLPFLESLSFNAGQPPMLVALHLGNSHFPQLVDRALGVRGVRVVEIAAGGGDREVRPRLAQGGHRIARLVQPAQP
jgi:hypothetical protein